jgi:ABC-type nickel/cobalt efflux system permease component RcnA
VKKKLLNFFGKLKENAVYVGLVITLIVLYCFDHINTEEKITWTSISSGLIAIIGLILFYERLKNQGEQVRIQGEQIQIQIKQRVDVNFI